VFDAKKDTFEGVPELIAVRAVETGLFTMTAEEPKKAKPKKG
jgi:hypothetical protein